MTAQVTFNPYLTSNGLGSFNITSDGFIQGTALDAPAVRYRLAGGILATTETLPMWGGVAISELTPTPGSPAVGASAYPNRALGTIVSRALITPASGGWQNAGLPVAGQITGFSVFDQNYGAVNSPQSPVPLVGSGGQVNLYRFGSGARIAVNCLSSLSSQEGALIAGPVSWDFTNQQLIPGIAAWAAEAANSATYTSSTGIIAITFGTAPFGAGIGAGMNGIPVTVSGFTTSAGNAALINGDFPVTGTASSGTIVSLQGPVGAGTITINSSTGTLAAGGGYLPVQVLDINIGNSMVVSYDSGTGFATWNRSGNCAIIQT